MVYRVVFDFTPEDLPLPTNVAEYCKFIPAAFEAFALYLLYLLLESKAKVAVTAAKKRQFLYQPLLCLCEMKRAVVNLRVGSASISETACRPDHWFDDTLTLQNDA